MEGASLGFKEEWMEEEEGVLKHEDSSEKSGDEILEYIHFLESELEHLKSHGRLTQAQHGQEKRGLKQQLQEALAKAEETSRELKLQMEAGAKVQTTVAQLKDEFEKTECLLWQEQNREKDLVTKIEELELELERKNELINHRRKRDERSRMNLEAENENLKKKTTLSWMLGCLTDTYLQLQPQGTTASLLKMVRRIQRELERENLVLSYSSKAPKLENNYVQSEIRRLIECCQGSEKVPEVVQDSPGKSGLSARSIEEQYIAEIGRSNIAQLSPKAPSSKVLKQKSLLESKYFEESSSPCSPLAIEHTNSSKSRAFNEDAFVTKQTCLEVYPPLQPEQQLIEVFEGNQPCNSIIHHEKMPLGDLNKWSEVKLWKMQDATMMSCQNEMKEMLSSIEMNLCYLLEQEKKRNRKEAQIRHLGYHPLQKVPDTALWKRRHWNF